jgi:fatty-acid desaturase
MDLANAHSRQFGCTGVQCALLDWRGETRDHHVTCATAMDRHGAGALHFSQDDGSLIGIPAPNTLEDEPA